MAIHADSTPALARPLLREVLPSGDLLPARRAELLAILEDAPSARNWGAFTRPQRRAIQTGVDALIDYLDALDDPDLEDDGDGEEPLGWPDRVSQLRLGANTADGDNTAPERHGGGFLFCSADDVEITCEDEGAETGDREPDLGALERIDQRSWAEFCHMDHEHSLGAPENNHDQRRWAQGRGSREMDHDEHCGLRSWGFYSKARQAVEKARRDTEAVLRRKRLIRADMDEVRIVTPGMAVFLGAPL